MFTISQATIIVGFAFLCLLFLIFLNKRSSTPKKENGIEDESVTDTLRQIRDKGAKIIVRANGQIMGYTNNGSERFHDDKYDVYRRRINYVNLDGEENVLPADAMSESRGKVNIMPIEHDGGVAVSEIKEIQEDGTLIRSPIYTSRRAKELREKDEELSTLRTEVRRMGDEYRTKDRNYRELQTKVNDLKEEKSNLEDDIENFRTANERLQKESEAFKARVQAAEEKNREYQREIKALAQSHKNIMGEVEGIIKKVEEMDMAKFEAGKVDIENKGMLTSSPSTESEEEESQEEE